MPPLPRGVCSVCKESVPVRVNGEAREHLHPHARSTCRGSGRPVEIPKRKTTKAAAKFLNARQPKDPAVSPFTTPGTRCRWQTVGDWLAHARSIEARHISIFQKRARAAHLGELARRVEWIAAQPPTELRELVAFLRATYKPVRGKRAGHPYTAILVEANNAIQRADAEETQTLEQFAAAIRRAEDNAPQLVPGFKHNTPKQGGLF